MGKYIPERTCIGCMKKFCQNELIRLVKAKDAPPSIDIGKKTSGRGAYICANVECVNLCEKKKRLTRALKCEIDPNFYEQIRDYIKGINQGE